MKRGRALLVTGGLLLVVGALVAGAWSYFFDPGGPLIEPTRRAPETGGDGDAPIDVPTSSRETRPTFDARAWPFAEFEDDLLALRREPEPEGFLPGIEIEVKHVTHLDDQRFDITMTDAEFEDVVDYLAEKMKPFGVPVYTREPGFSEIVTFNLDMRDVRVIDVVREMHIQSRRRLRWHVSQLGFCLGGWEACENDKLERSLTEARRRAEFDAKTPVLQIEYRPDFDNAHIGDVVRDIKEKTGVDVIVAEEIWESTSRMNWRSGKRPLSSVLYEISVTMGAVLRERGGRAFLIAP